MTIGLQITDGTTTIDLNDGSYFEIMELDLGYGGISAIEVTGSVRLYINGTKAQIQTELAALQKILQAAMEYQGTGEGGALYSSLDAVIYIQYRTDGTEAYYRSPIIRATTSVEPGSMETLNFDCGGIEYVIDFERKNWWEGAEAQIQLATALVNATTNAVTVYNPAVSYTAATIAFVSATKKITDSANGLANFQTGTTLWVSNSGSNNGVYTIATGGVAGEIVVVEALADEGASANVQLVGETANYTDIAAGAVGGDMPSATRLEILNTYNYANGIQILWIGQNFKNPLTFPHLLEAESATGTSDTLGMASGGYYVDSTVGSGAEVDLLDWTISGTILSAAAGRWFKALIKFQASTNVNSFKFRLQIEYNGAVIWKGPQVSPDATRDLAILDILTFQLPPSLAGLSNLAEMHLVLTAYQNSGVNLTLGIDFIQLTPVDGYRELYGAGGAAEYNRRIVDDGIIPALYEDDGSGSGKTPNWVGYSTPIMLQPGRAQRLYFLNHTQGGGISRIQHTTAVKLYYRPRRLSI